MSVLPAATGVNVSVREFMEGVFGPDLPNAWVCATRSADAPDWKGSSAGSAHLDGAGWDDHNCYYSVAVLKHGATSRKDVNWSHTRVVVVDDVEEKADAGRIRACLGEPSFVVRTSPQSFQWGYILATPITDPNVQARLMRAITLAFFKGIEPGHRDLTRYVRLPAGINNKASRVSANGGTAPVVSCVRWEPALTYTVDELVAGLRGVDSALDPSKSAWSDAEGTKVLVSGSNVNGTGGTYKPALMSEVDTWIAEGDYILDAFVALGWLVGEDNNGYFKVRCPWDMSGVIGHTHTNTDDRSSWSPERFLRNEKGWSCHHSDGSLDPKGRRDHEVMDMLRDELERVSPGVYDALEQKSFVVRRAKAVQLFASNPPSQTGMLVLQTGIAGALGVAAPGEWVSYGKDAPATPIPQRRRIFDSFARGEVTYITAQPAAGKSAIGCVAIPLAMAADKPLLIGELNPLGFERVGDVYLVSNEDNADMVRKRAAGWMKHNNLTKADLAFDTVVNKTQGFVAVRKDDRHGEVRIGEDLEALGVRIKAADVSVCMVLLDTQATVFSGISENDNSDAGACGRILTAWAKEHNVSLVIVHHMQKANGRAGGGGDQTSLRGASGFAGMMRNGVTLVGLSDEEIEALDDPKERDSWAYYEGSKSNHGPKSAGRWFRKHIVKVEVLDERTNAMAEDEVPVYVYEGSGPKWKPGADGDDAQYTVTAIVCELEGHGVPLRVSVTGDKTGMMSARDFLSERLGNTPTEAGAALKAVVKSGLVYVGDGPLNPNNNRPKVYRATKEGTELVEDRKRAAADMDVSDPNWSPV